MEKEKFEILMLDYLSGALEQNDKNKFEKLLQNRPEYQDQFDGMTQIWNLIEESELLVAEEVSDNRFYQALHMTMLSEKELGEPYRNQFWVLLENLLRPKKFAYGLLLVILGLGFGYLLSSSFNRDIKTEIVGDETKKLREKFVLTLLEQPSANRRLQGIGEANKITQADISVINALFQTLNYDSNVNVRLAAIKSLAKYADNPLVREGLVESILMQNSPIVQVTLANLMVELQEKKSVEPFKVLISNKNLDSSVKEKLELSIQSII